MNLPGRKVRCTFDIHTVRRFLHTQVFMNISGMDAKNMIQIIFE
jgi:hypothetical protein